MRLQMLPMQQAKVTRQIRGTLKLHQHKTSKSTPGQVTDCRTEEDGVICLVKQKKSLPCLPLKLGICQDLITTKHNSQEL